MANPRQRRKMRSGTAKVKTSKQSIKNKHKVIVKGPQELADAWDKNYASLGLLHSSNPRQAGGLEPTSFTPFAISSATPQTVQDLEAALDAQIGSSDSETDSEQDGEGEEETKGKGREEKLRPGMARIVRDQQGNVVSIIMGGEDGRERQEKVKAPIRGGEDSESEAEDDEEEQEEASGDETMTPWGPPMKDFSTRKAENALAAEEEEDEEMLSEGEGGGQEGFPQPLKTKQGIPLGGPLRIVAPKSAVVAHLEQKSSFKPKVIRHTSTAEHDWLVSLVQKHGEDVGKMARDRRGNVWQKTEGELKRMIKKAGGFEKLRQ
ncbi:hypothetical protein JCM11641_001688 [Rhodosporidiobolus odoratus]